ncbi:uncharacterized protein LOC109422049 [Aedes albopictus]|uniref:Peptidase S1 domain-containing protein n=1 Tax=Aedes albopictus TaxID=7160 RepID=A0ABM1YE84_AEDAL
MGPTMVALSLLLQAVFLLTSASTAETRDVNTSAATCGLPSADHRRPLIVKGEPASSVGEWPWHASIWHRITHGTYVYVCGGTLLSELYVLTAGHCVSKEGNALNERLITVQVGSVRQNLLLNGFPVQNLGVAENILHEEFALRSFQADVAMLVLETKVAFNEFVRPACLPDAGGTSDGKELYGRQAVAVGFGKTEQAETSYVLRKIRLPIVDYVTCLESNRKVFGSTLSAGVLCAGHRNGSTICNGDSGGGLLTEDDGGRWVLRGVISFSAQRGWNDTSCSLTDYSAFVNVAYYGRWIRYVMEHGDQRGFFNRTSKGSESGGEIERMKVVKPLRISEKKCKEYRRRGLTRVRPAATTHTTYFKNTTVTRSDTYTKSEYVLLNANETDVGLVYYLDDRYAITTVEVANDCTLEYVVCRTNHGAVVRQVMVHPEYHEGTRDFNVAIVETDQTDEFFWCIAAVPSSILRLESKKLSLSSIANESFSWVEFDIDYYLRTKRGIAVQNDRQDEIAGLLQNSPGEPVVMSNLTAVLNWVESVMWNVTYVKETVGEVKTEAAEPAPQLRSSEAACKRYRRAGLTSVNPANPNHIEVFKNATLNKSFGRTKSNAVELLQNGTSLGLIYYLAEEYAITIGSIASNCTPGVCATEHDQQVLQKFVHPRYAGGRDFNVAVLRTTLADEFFVCLAVEPPILFYNSGRRLPLREILGEQPTWTEFDSEVYLRLARGAALYSDRRDEIAGLLQNGPGQELVMTNVTALVDWIEPIVWDAAASSIEPR